MSSFYFAEVHGSKTEIDYLFIDQSFVGSIFCKKDGDNYLVDLWVTSSRPNNSPCLVLRARFSIQADKNKLDKELQNNWKRFFMKPAIASSKCGGIAAETQDFKLLPLDSQHNLIQGHLFAHDKNEHFNYLGYSKVAKTASMYLLLTTLGTKQPQKAIAAYEDSEMLGEVKTTAINQRLALAKKAGLL